MSCRGCSIIFTLVSGHTSKLEFVTSQAHWGMLKQHSVTRFTSSYFEPTCLTAVSGLRGRLAFGYGSNPWYPTKSSHLKIPGIPWVFQNPNINVEYMKHICKIYGKHGNHVGSKIQMIQSCTEFNGFLLTFFFSSVKTGTVPCRRQVDGSLPPVCPSGQPCTSGSAGAATWIWVPIAGWFVENPIEMHDLGVPLF